MKLPRSEEKFVVIDKDSDLFNVVVSGVHIELWGDDDCSGAVDCPCVVDCPGAVLYCVYASMVYDGFFRAKCLRVCFCMERALDFIARCLIPYQEPEPEAQPVIPGGSSGEGGADGQ